MARLNPRADGQVIPYTPTHCVTGVLDARSDLVAAVQVLGRTGVAQDDIDVFLGDAGERSLDPTGSSGTGGRWFRKLENWVSDTSKFQELVTDTLASGGAVVAAHVGDDESRKAAAMKALTALGARDVKYWSPLYVEQGHEDVPRQNLMREDG